MAFDVSEFGLDRSDLPPGWMAERFDTIAFFNPDQIGGGYPHSEIAYLDIGNVATGVIGNPAKLSLADAPSRAKRIVRPNDTILSTVRPGNRAYAFLREVPDNLVVSTGFAVIRARQGTADPRFVYYLASGDPIINYLASIAEEKTAYPSVNPGDIAECVVPIPPPFRTTRHRPHPRHAGRQDRAEPADERDAGGNGAGALQVVVRGLRPRPCQGRRRRPRPAPVPRDLFPDSFEDSELGEIPRGWEVGTLGDILFQIVDRCSASDETRSRPYVPIECIAARSLLLAENKPGEEAQSSLTRFRKGELLFGAMRPYFHKVAIAPFDGTTRTTVFVLRPRQADEFSFATLLLHDARTIEYATNHSTGSTIPYAGWQGSLETMPIVLPPGVVRKSFDRTVRPLLDRIPPVFFANRTLAALRDALLPKLISGELRVKDAERFVAEATA